MFAAVVVALCLALAGPARGMDDEMAELAKMVRDNCAEEIGVDIALLTAVDNGGDLQPDPKLKCYIKCTMETAGMMSDGVVDVDAVLGLLPEALKARSEGHIRKCDTQKGADDCDTAFKTQQCWQNASKKDYFLV
ncbi:hypothetical protein O0L34_g14048 [Tuta absoluta]|nr:hypothetical protein O0L34_g14048 [Tuta absoluta]